jgi:death-on-curing protein
VTSEPVWLTIEDAIALNQWVVEETGERHVVRDAGLLESALHRPQTAYFYSEQTDIVMLATLLLFGIAQNHPFEQGNKRTGFFAAVAFLGMNEVVLTIPDIEAFADAFVEVLAAHSPIELFAREWLAPHAAGPTGLDP